jgi:hypothetical protein
MKKSNKTTGLERGDKNRDEKIKKRRGTRHRGDVNNQHKR